MILGMQEAVRIQLGRIVAPNKLHGLKEGIGRLANLLWYGLWAVVQAEKLGLMQKQIQQMLKTVNVSGAALVKERTGANILRDESAAFGCQRGRSKQLRENDRQEEGQMEQVFKSGAIQMFNAGKARPVMRPVVAQK